MVLRWDKVSIHQLGGYPESGVKVVNGGKIDLHIGKTYLVSTQRKGTFMMRITGKCDTWTHGVVVGGSAKAMLDYNVKGVGEEVSCRTSFILSAVEQPS